MKTLLFVTVTMIMSAAGASAAVESRRMAGMGLMQALKAMFPTELHYGTMPDGRACTVAVGSSNYHAAVTIYAGGHNVQLARAGVSRYTSVAWEMYSNAASVRAVYRLPENEQIITTTYESSSEILLEIIESSGKLVACAIRG